MVGHFQRDHLAGDGPEIDRWKRRVAELEQERDEALMLAEGPSTLKDLAALSFERACRIATLERALSTAREARDFAGLILAEHFPRPAGRDLIERDVVDLARQAVDEHTAALAKVERLRKALEQIALGVAFDPYHRDAVAIAYAALLGDPAQEQGK